MRRLLARWFADDDGQDVLEYALLGGFVGFSALAGVNYLTSVMNSTYATWDSVGQSDALVEVPDPQP
jgi:Flp pilus assembly pilin Flp